MPPPKGYVKSPEHLARIVAANQWRIGRPLSDETRAKISAARKGQKQAPRGEAWRQALSGALKGRTIPIEARANMSAAAKGKVISPETRAKMSAAHKGKIKGPLSVEHRAKLRLANLGNTYTTDASIKGECVYCFGPAQTYDHVIPRGRDGWDAPDNVVPACYRCNAQKSNRTPEEWFAT